MIHAERSFWESELYGRQYDLIVIGAGLTGQSTAHFYKQAHPNASVMVLDRGFSQLEPVPVMPALPASAQ